MKIYTLVCLNYFLNAQQCNWQLWQLLLLFLFQICTRCKYYVSRSYLFIFYYSTYDLFLQSYRRCLLFGQINTYVGQRSTSKIVSEAKQNISMTFCFNLLKIVGKILLICYPIQLIQKCFYILKCQYGFHFLVPNGSGK